MTNLSTLTLKCLGMDRAVVQPTLLSMLFDPRKGYAQIIEYRPRGVQHTARVTLPWCTTREGARYTAEVATHFLMRPLPIVPAAQNMGVALQPAQRPAQRPAAPPAQRPAPGSPPAQRPAQR